VPVRSTPSVPVPVPSHLELAALPRVASACVATIALATLAGWLTGREVLTSFLAGRVPMNPATAVAFGLASVALWLSATPGRRGAAAWIARACAATTACVGAACALQYFGGPNPGVDQWLFADRLARAPEGPNRMAPNTAVSFVLLGLALLTLDREPASGRRPAQHLALVVAFASLLGVTGYVYGAETHRVYSYIPMALNTAVAFGLAAVGTLAARPAAGFVALFTSRRPIGALGRRVLVAALTMPWAIGWIGLELESIGFFGPDHAVAFLAVSTMAVLAIAAWWALRSLDRVEQRRAAAEAAQRESDAAAARLEARIALANRVVGTFATAGDDAPDAAVLDVLCEAFGSPYGLLVGVDAGGRFLCADRATPADVAPPVEAPEAWPGPWGTVFRERRPVAANAPHRLPPDRAVARSIGAPVVFGGELIGVVHLADRPHDYGDDDVALLAELAAAMAPALGHRLARLLRHRERQRATDDLAALNRRLAAANRELEAFSYSVSHDLRAPLRAIDGFARILVEDHAPRLDADARRALDVVRENAQRMGRLIDDLLALSRLGRKELVRTPVDVGALVRAVVDEVARLEPDRVVAVTIGELPVTVADAGMLRQVFANLVGNAFKYTRRTADPRVEIGSVRDASGVVYFVRDNGTGFDMRSANRLFQVFHRLHRADEFEGTGIGLATVQRIVQRHGGRVWAEGAVGRGATFRFTLGEPPDAPRGAEASR